MRYAAAFLLGALATVTIAGSTIEAQPGRDSADPRQLAHTLLVEEVISGDTFVTGYVRNTSRYRVGNVRLRVETADGAGSHVAPEFGWVDGDIPAGQRTAFRVSRPANGTGNCLVTVESFDLMSLDSASKR